MGKIEARSSWSGPNWGYLLGPSLSLGLDLQHNAIGLQFLHPGGRRVISILFGILEEYEAL